MSEDRSWGADTVAFGRASREPSRPAPPSGRPARPKLPTIALRPLALVTVAIVTVVALIVAAGGGSDSQKAPIREVADPAPRVVVEQAPRASTRVRRREPRDAMKPHARRAEARQLKPKGEQKASAATQAQAAPEPSAEPTPEYLPPPAPEPPAPAPPAPTPPAAEFGL